MFAHFIDAYLNVHLSLTRPGKWAPADVDADVDSRHQCTPSSPPAYKMTKKEVFSRPWLLHRGQTAFL
jgi:hypothetical protein